MTGDITEAAFLLWCFPSCLGEPGRERGEILVYRDFTPLDHYLHALKPLGLLIVG